MKDANIEFKDEIAKKQKFVSTWKAVVDGKIYVVKKICLGDPDKTSRLAAKLGELMRLRTALPDAGAERIFLYDFIQSGEDYVAVAREWREGESLKSELAGGRLFTVKESVNLTLKVAHILQQAQDYNLVHGNLKPSNIILNGENDVSVVDWTKAELLESIKDVFGEDYDSMDEFGFEDPEYLAVEQMLDGTQNRQCDVYALGVILHQLLTGELPIGNTDSMSVTDIAIAKQKPENETVDLCGKYPQLKIPSDLEDVVNDALKTNCSQRIASIDDFIKRLEALNQSETTKTTVESNPSSSVGQNMTEAPTRNMGIGHKLVLIGHTGAGKTVLMAGLYATQGKNFTVLDPGSKTGTGQRAINARTTIENGEWPPATSYNDLARLKFRIVRKGREETICFDEYAGERVPEADYDREIVGNPEGAFILLNPGAPQWSSPREKNTFISDIKHCIDLLSKKSTNPVVALVVTANDRLQGDLKDRASEFQLEVERLKKLLELRGCTHKVFHVSVTGKLDNQKIPKLDPQNVKEPFIWFLDKIAGRQKFKLVKSILKIGFGAAVSLAAVVAGEWWREGRHTVHFNAGYENKAEWGKYKKGELRPIFLFSDQRAKYEKAVEALEFRIDEENCRKCEDILNKALEDATPDKYSKANLEIDKLVILRDENKSKKDDLKRRRDSELPLAKERYDTKVLVEKFAVVCKKVEAKAADLDKGPSNDELSREIDSLKKDYGKWCALKSALPGEERAALVDRMKKQSDNLEKTWPKIQMAVERKEIKDLEERLQAFASKPGDQEKLDKLQKECEARVAQKTTLPAEEHIAATNRLQELSSKAKDAWMAVQKRIVTDWFDGKTTDPVDEVLRAYKAFCVENRGNPYFDLAEAKIVERVNNGFNDKLKKWGSNSIDERWYRGMNEFCCAICNTTSDSVKASKHYEFALKYRNWVDTKPWGVEIIKIQAVSSFKYGAYIKAVEVSVCTRDKNKNCIVDTAKPHVLYQDPDGKAIINQSLTFLLEISPWPVECKPWEQVEIRLLKVMENIKWGLDRSLGDKVIVISNNGEMCFDQQNIASEGGYATITIDKITLKIYFKVTGKPFQDLIKEVYGQ